MNRPFEKMTGCGSVQKGVKGNKPTGLKSKIKILQAPHLIRIRAVTRYRHYNWDWSNYEPSNWTDDWLWGRSTGV